MSSERTIPQHIITEHRSDGSMGRKYEPLKLIGQGGSAIAFSAKVLDINGNPTGEICLLKEFFPSKNAARNDDDSIRVLLTDSNKALKKQFLYEVSAGYAASEHIYGTTTALSSFESEKKNTYILMPYEKHGMSLEFFCDWLRKNGKTVPVRAWARLFYKLSDRVRNLHEKAEMLHSDISIGNVMIMQSDDPNELYDYVCDDKADYSVIILDFGCAYFKNDEDSEGDEDSKADENNVYAYNGRDILTAKKRDVVFTTKEFASPELLKDTHQEITTYTDIYSIVACFKYCIHAVESGDKYIFSADIPATAKAQVNKILGILHADESEYIYKARVLMEMFDELIRRIDGKGVSKAAIWEAARRDYQRKLSGRFSGLKPGGIIEEILPRGHRTSFDIFANENEGRSIKVLELIKKHQTDNLLLIGMGGIGKTTTLVSVLQSSYAKEKSYDETEIVPIYIELNRAPNRIDALGDNHNSAALDSNTTNKHGLIVALGDNESTFILRYIVSLLYDVRFSEVKSEVLEILRHEFSKETDTPEYVLLLDGLNEVSNKWIDEMGTSVQGIVISEIQNLIKQYKNIRVIITSRNEHTGIDGNGINLTRINLNGITKESVFAYLNECGLSERIAIIENNIRLQECLQTPLFLIMYCGITDDYENITSRGEIFRYFWNEVTVGYSQNYISRRAAEGHDFTEQMFMFVTDFIAPAVCDDMEMNSLFHIDKDRIFEIVDCVLNDVGKIGILGEYGIRFFEKYCICITDYEEDILTVAEQLLSLKRYKQRILVELINMGILVKTNRNTYDIKHHFFRDYFAAVYTVNQLGLAYFINDKNNALAFECLSSFSNNSLRKERAILVGEYLGEHKNFPRFIEETKMWVYNVPDVTVSVDRNLLKRVLDIYRGRFDGSVGYGVYNIIEILKNTRTDLSGSDFSRLDLSNCALNGFSLGGRHGVVKFRGSLIFRDNLFPVGHFDGVNSIAFSPDGKHIVSASRDRTIKVWNADTYSIVKTIEGHLAAVTDVSYSPDGKYIISSSRDKTIKIWNVGSYTLVKSLEEHSDEVTSISFDPCNRYFISTSCDKTLKLWDLSTFSLVKTFASHLDKVKCAVFSTDGKYIVSASKDKTIKIWNVNSFSLTLTIQECSEITSISFSSDGKRFITALHNGTIKIWDALSFTSVANLNGVSHVVSSVAFSPDGKSFVTGSWDTTVKIWDVSTLSLMASLVGHTDAVTDVSYSPDGKHIISASRDKSIKIWDSLNFSLAISIEGYSRIVNDALINPNGQYFALVSRDKTIKIWSMLSRSLVAVICGHSDDITSALFSNDGKNLITTSKDHTIRIWDSSIFHLIKILQGHLKMVTSASVSPKGKYIVSSSMDKSIIVWNTSQFKPIKICNGHTGYISSIAFSPDGRYFVSASNDKTIIVWSASTFSPIKTINMHSGGVTKAIFTPDGKYLISSSRDKTIKIFDAFSFELLKTLTGHLNSVNCVAISPDGKTIVSASDDKTIVIWDVIWDTLTFLPIKTLNEHLESVNSVAFDKDGDNIFSSSNDGTIKIWDSHNYQCLDTIPNIPGLSVIGVDMRNLHPDSHFSEADKMILKQYGAIID